MSLHCYDYYDAAAKGGGFFLLQETWTAAEGFIILAVMMKAVNKFTFLVMEELKGTPQNELAADLKQRDVPFHATQA